MDKFRNKYRISSTRLRGKDYGLNGEYFLTICTKDRIHFFGNIDINGVIHLSHIGELAKKFILEIPKRYEYALLDEFVVMPNHVHLIISIRKKQQNNEKENNPNLLKSGGITGQNNPMLHDNISRIMNWLAGRITFESHKINKNFGWQSRFWDRIIRDNIEYQCVKKYIKNNPSKWVDDCFHT